MKTDNPYYNSKVQKILNKLISEEWLAGNMYRFYKLAVIPEEAAQIVDLFDQIGEDELDEHYTDMVNWATTYGYDVPCSIREFEKYAGIVSVKLFNTFKKCQNAEYYIKKVIEAEEDAIKSYQEALSELELAAYGDLQAILMRNYTDEIEHLEKLQIFKYADSITSIQIA